MKTIKKTILEDLDAIHEAWTRGELSWKLLPHERTLYDFIRKASETLHPTPPVGHCARGFGKTKVLLIIMLEDIIKDGGGTRHYIAPIQSQARDILTPLALWIGQDAPQGLRPIWHSQETALVLPGMDAMIKVYGTDGKQYDKARGQTITGLAAVDEAGFCDDLEIMVRDVLGPACRKGGGQVVMVSTSPESIAHPFVTYAEHAKQYGIYFKRTIDDNKSWNDVKRRQAIEESGGEDTATYKREYLSQFVQDERWAVVPEWTDDVEARCCVGADDRPEYYYSCGALDPGTKDHTGYVCGYYDFKRAKYVLTGEWFARGQTTDEIVDGIGNAENGLRVDRRVSDTNLQVIVDLTRLHGLAISPVKKIFLQSMVNNLRMIVKDERLELVNCPITARQLKTAQWDRNKDAWKRTDADGHYDCLAALVYWVMSIDTQSNPWPAIPKNLKIQDYFDRLGRKPGEVKDGWDELAEVL